VDDRESDFGADFLLDGDIERRSQPTESRSLDEDESVDMTSSDIDVDDGWRRLWVLYACATQSLGWDDVVGEWLFIHKGCLAPFCFLRLHTLIAIRLRPKCLQPSCQEVLVTASGEECASVTKASEEAVQQLSIAGGAARV
jgi:hypothetical protein